MIDSADALFRRNLYAKKQQIAIIGELGHGQDGAVWRTDRNSAVKVFYREESFSNEVACYLRLQERNIRTVKAFSVPELIDFDRRIRVLEINIVTAPYILDFGKARVDYEPDFSAEVMADLDADITDWWGEEYAPEIRSIIRMFKVYGIYYPDPRPGNIKLPPNAGNAGGR